MVSWLADRGAGREEPGGQMHIQFRPGLRTVWRGAGSVQVGLSGRRGTVLDGLTAADARVIEGLRTETGLRDAPARSTEQRQRELIGLLDEAGVLLTQEHPPRPGSAVAEPDRLAPDAALWSRVHPASGDGWPLIERRAAQRVLVAGTGRLGSTLAATLAAAGVGQLCLLDDARVTAADIGPAAARRADLGRTRQDAAADAVLRAGGRASTATSVPGQVLGRAGRSRDDTGAVDLVVLVEYAVADAAGADVLVAHDVPHLSVVIREDDILVGPMVRPGAGPCLRCLDLHRSERDPAWPSVLAQSVNRPADGPREESALSMLAAGLAAMQVLAQLDGLAEPAAAGATLEVEPPDGLIARRPWPAHPSCGCHWPLRATPVAAGDVTGDELGVRPGAGAGPDAPADAPAGHNGRRMGS